MNSVRASKAALDVKQATQDARAALAQPHPVASERFLKAAQNKYVAANPVVKTLDEAEAAGAQVESYVEAGERHLTLVDTHDDPRLVNVAAQHQRLDLAESAGVLDLALDLTQSLGTVNTIERCLAHQMAAAHSQAMKLQARANEILSGVSTLSGPATIQMFNTEGVRLLNASARQMAAFQAAAETLARLRIGGKQTVTVVHQHVQVAGVSVAVAGSVQTGGRR